MNTTLVTRTAGLIIACLLAALPVAAQDASIPSIGADGSPSAEQLESAIQSIEARGGLDEELSASIVQQLRSAQAQLQSRIDAEAAAAAYSESLASDPAETEALRASLDAAHLILDHHVPVVALILVRRAEARAGGHAAQKLRRLVSPAGFSPA